MNPKLAAERAQRAAPGPQLRKGQQVTISGNAGICAGTILDIRQAGDLLPVIEAPQLALVAACMREIGITHYAAISHMHAGRLVCFAAVRDAAGQWRDLHAQRLTITPSQEAQP
jgi:hypothetical protein